MATSTQNSIESFVDTLMQETSLTSLPAEIIPEYREQLMHQVERRVGVIILGALSEDKQAEYLQQFVEPDEVDGAALNAFIDENIEDFPGKLQTGLEEFVRQFAEALETTKVTN